MTPAHTRTQWHSLSPLAVQCRAIHPIIIFRPGMDVVLHYPISRRGIPSCHEATGRRRAWLPLGVEKPLQDCVHGFLATGLRRLANCDDKCQPWPMTITATCCTVIISARDANLRDNLTAVSPLFDLLFTSIPLLSNGSNSGGCWVWS